MLHSRLSTWTPQSIDEIALPGMLLSRFLLFLLVQNLYFFIFFFFFQAEDGIRDLIVTGVQTCALPISVVRIGAIITHDKIAVGGNPVRYFQLVRLGGAGGVLLDETLSVDPYRTVVNVNGVAGKADHALHIVGRVRSKGRLEDNDLLTLGIAPQGD